MDLNAIRTEVRRIADDKTDPPHNTDADLAKSASEAEREACVRGRLLYDDTSTFLTINVNPADLAALNTAVNPLVDEIDAGFYLASGSTRRQGLTICGLDWINQRDPGNSMTGQPSHIARVGARGLRLWPRPTTAGVLTLSAWRRPLLDMDTGADEPEIEAKHHDGLIDWMLYRAYQTKDAENGDAELSKLHYNLFEARFGPRRDADAQARFREHRRVTTRYGGL